MSHVPAGSDAAAVLAALRDALDAAARSNETISKMANEDQDYYLYDFTVDEIVSSIQISDTPIEPPSPASPPPGTAVDRHTRVTAGGRPILLQGRRCCSRSDAQPRSPPATW